MSQTRPETFRIDNFVSSMEQNQYWIIPNLIPPAHQQQLLQIAKMHYKAGDFSPAKIGKGVQKKRIKEIRGDMIYWLEDWNLEPVKEYKKILEQILLFGRRGLYLPLKRFEAHMAFYPVGTRYLKHVDRHQQNPSRLLSVILYVGEWQTGDGGELVIYFQDSHRSPISIEPHPRQLVVFDSRLVHEVKMTHVPRWSFTSWFRDDVHPLLNL